MLIPTNNETLTRLQDSVKNWGSIKRPAKLTKMPPSSLIILSKEEVESLLKRPEVLSDFGIDEQRIFFRSLAFWDWAFWIQVVCERWTVEKKTGEIFESADFHFELWGAYFNGDDVLAIIGRANGKTTNVSKMASLYALCFMLEPEILLIASKGLGEEIIGDLREELEGNILLKFIFGEQVPKMATANKSKKWRGRELQLLSGSEIKSVSKGESIRGRRPTKIIMDDPQEDKDVKNPIIANEFYNWIFTTVYPTLADGGSMFVLGTIISSICFVNMLKQQVRFKGFRLIEYPALLDFNPKTDIEFVQESDHVRVIFKKGRPLWPQRWTLEKLAQRCQKMIEDGSDIRKFLQEYCNIPFVFNSSPVFETSIKFQIMPLLRKIGTFGIDVFREFRFVTVEEEGQPVSIPDPKLFYSIGIDVANGKQNGDYSTVTMRDLDFRLYRQYRGHCAQHILAEVVEQLLEGIENVVVVPENNIALAFLNAAAEYRFAQKFYKQRSFDKATNKESDVIGWHTNIKTKMIMINGLQRFYGTGNAEVSKEQVEEIEHYYYDEHGGMNATAPHHDDLVISDSLSVQGILHGVPDVMPEFI